jgi:hypothetical protein
MEGLGRTGSLLEPIALTYTLHVANAEASAFEHTPQLQVRPCAVHSMHSPFNVFKGLSRRIPAGKCGERWQSAFSPSVNVRKFHDQSVVLDLEATKQVGGSSLEYNRLVAEHDGVEFVVGQSEHFVYGVALDQDLGHRGGELCGLTFDMSGRQRRR